MTEQDHILIVDDQVENLNLLENVLGGDHKIHRAPDARTALQILQKNPIRLVLTDQRMPGMGGVALLEKVREVRPDAVRMLITAYPDIDVAVDAINQGQVKRYIPKPFDPSELRTIVRQELEHADLAIANRRLTEELARKVEELQELDRMKNRFLANVSHELKTPLVSGLGYIDLLLTGNLGPPAPRHVKGLRIAHRNLQRLLDLIEDLLALARLRRKPEGLKKSVIDLSALIHECVESLRARSRKKSLNIRVSVPADLPRVHGDEKRIHSVITNVLSNAEKFTPDPARISIRARATADSRCVVQVTDNGIGLPKGQKGDAIEFFHHSDNERAKKYGGLGIGLVLAREVLTAHGGSIRMEARKGRPGTTVTFDLPLKGAGKHRSKKR